jgi:serine/threonine protein kinase/sugar lactone lactonase YvrE
MGPGSRLAGYRLEAQIGAGGMAVVYSAVDERLGRRVALKVLAPGLAADAEFRQRFVRESKAATAVEDPHIIPVYEAGEAHGVLFIAMRFVSGGDLRSVMRREGPATPVRAAALISPVASALDAAHRAGLVHRDVKPGNVLVDTQPGRPDHVYLSDFGLSKSVLSTGGLTGAGRFLGTPEFAAPEQISGRKVDGRADQYALACLAFELLAGSAPFARTEPLAVLWAHTSEPPPSLAAVRPDLPDSVDQVLARALEKEPANRFGSCQDFADAFRAALGLPGYGVASASPALPQAALPQAAPAQAAPAAAEPWWESISNGRVAAPTLTYVPPPSPPSPDLPQGSPPGQSDETQVQTTQIQPPRRRRYRDLGVAAVAIALVAGIITAVVLNDDDGSRNAHRPSAGGSAAADRKTSTSPSARPTGRSSPSSSAAAKPKPNASPSVRPLTVSVHQTATLLDGIQEVPSVAFNPDGTILATAYADSTELWDTRTHNQIAILTDPDTNDTRIVESVAFSPDGSTLAAADWNGDVYLWNLASQSTTATLVTPGSGWLSSVVFSPNGTLVAAGDNDGSAYVWNAATGALVATLADPGKGSHSVESVAFSPDGKTLATGDGNGDAYLWNVATGAHIATLADPTANAGSGSYGVNSVAFSPDGKTLATGDCDDDTTYLWNVATRTRVAALPDPGSGLSSVAFSPDGKLVAASDWNGSAYVWDVATGTRAAVITDPAYNGARSMLSVAFGPGAGVLATGDIGYAFLWHIAGG